MNKKDVIYAIICGLAVAWIGVDFFRQFGLLFFFVMPIMSVFGLWLVDLLGRKWLFVRQMGKFVLAGSFADVVDIRVFQVLFWLLPFSLFFKAVSFAVATLVKYWCDKYWTFEKNENKDMPAEIFKFFLVAVVGAGLNVVSFYYLARIRVGISINLWIELSIILAAIAAGLWNFLGYKFLVFKK